jgi:alkyl hydroperoxide reductase subunit F
MEQVDRVTQEADYFLVHLEGGDQLEAKSVIIATGTRQQFLDVPGEREYLSKGLCYSAISYAPLFIEKKTVVIGGGNLALRSTAELATVAEHVHLVGPRDDVLETPLGKKVKASPNVTVLEEYEVTRVLGNGYAERVVVRDPEGNEMDIPADGIFIEKALIPNTKMVTDLVETTEDGFVVVDCYGQTNVPGIFAAGDVTHIMAEQVLVAVGEGVKAALGAYDYLLPTL